MKGADGNALRKPEGCMKCGDIKHRHTCNHLSNCFWNKHVKSKDSKGGNVGTCQSCSSVKSQNTCDNYELTDGQCQWRTDSSDSPNISSCQPSHLYPIIYEWIWYNKWFLLSVIACLLVIFKFPTDAIPYPYKIGVIILKFILAVVTIPALSVLIKRADGEDGRKFYIDPPFDVKNPGLNDFIYDQNKLGAKWPAIIYDSDWDNIIMDHDNLRKLVDFEVGPWILNWGAPIWMLMGKWNELVNSIGNGALFVVVLLAVLLLGGIYYIGKLFKFGIESEMILYILIGIIVFTIYMYHFINKRSKYLIDKKIYMDPNGSIYNGRPYVGKQNEDIFDNILQEKTIKKGSTVIIDKTKRAHVTDIKKQGDKDDDTTSNPLTNILPSVICRI